MRKPLSAFFFFFFTVSAKSQSDSTASTVYREAVKNAIAVYHKARGSESNLYIGQAEEQLVFSGKGTPYYGSGNLNSGSVFYDGVLYEGVLLKYDLVRDQLVAFNPNTRNAFYLFKPRVDYFTLGTKTFVNLRKGKGKSAPPEGYYEVLTSGSITMLEKHAKSFQENLSLSNMEQRFDEKKRFYALKDGIYHPVAKAKSLYKLTGSLKNQIKTQLNKRSNHAGNDLEATLTNIAEYYNQLTH